jgi:hypothetical protein
MEQVVHHAGLLLTRSERGWMRIFPRRSVLGLQSPGFPPVPPCASKRALLSGRFPLSGHRPHLLLHLLCNALSAPGAGRSGRVPYTGTSLTNLLPELPPATALWLGDAASLGTRRTPDSGLICCASLPSGSHDRIVPGERLPTGLGVHDGATSHNRWFGLRNDRLG